MPRRPDGVWLNPAFDGDLFHPGCKDDLDTIDALLGIPGTEASADPRFGAAGRRLAALFDHEHAIPAIHALAGMLMERSELVIATDTEAAKLLVSLRP